MTLLEWITNKSINGFFAVWPQKRPSQQLLSNARLVAHRGVHEHGLAIENSREAFRLAVEHRIWAIEFDIHFTADDIPVINHDPDCGRLHQRPDLKIVQTTFAELRKAVPQILSLDEMVTEFGHKIHFMIEIKEDLRHAPHRVAAIRECLSGLKPLIDYHFLALVPEYLEAFAFAPKSALMDVIWLNAQEIRQRNRELGHGGIAGHFLFFDSHEIKSLQRSGKHVGVGFLESRNSLFRELNRGADFIFTNHPLRLQRYLQP